jgi:thiamine kinase-like enzyme
MKLPRLLEKEILKAVRRKCINVSSKDIQDFVLTVDDTFKHDGMSGAEIQRVEVMGFKNNTKTAVRFVVKPWESTKWLTQLLGVEEPLENILFEYGFFQEVNAIEGLSVPIVGSVQLENKAWIIMDDVSAELETWKTSAFTSSELEWQCKLLDRIALFHVSSEHNQSEKRHRFLRKQIVPQERRLRWFEQLCQEWFGGESRAETDSPALRKAKNQISEVAREVFLSFIARLPKESRIIWQNYMQHRDSLVSEASRLPVTFLHGDLLWKNIGLRQEASKQTFVLIDWEIATLGHPAFDVYYFISEPFRAVNVWDELFEYYYERYQFYGGSDMNQNQWERGIELAIAHYGLSWLPLFAERARRDSDDEANLVVENIIERTNRALHSVPFLS